MNDRLLKSKMVAAGETQKDLAVVIGVSTAAFNAKLKGQHSQFKLGEIRKLKDHLQLTPEEVDQIFFDVEVS